MFAGRTNSRCPAKLRSMNPGVEYHHGMKKGGGCFQRQLSRLCVCTTGKEDVSVTLTVLTFICLSVFFFFLWNARAHDLSIGMEKCCLHRPFLRLGQRLPAKALWLFGLSCERLFGFFSSRRSIESMPAALTTEATSVSVPWQPIHAWPALPSQTTS